MTEPQNVKEIRKLRLQVLIDSHFAGNRRAFYERIGITKGRLSQMLIDSFGDSTARSIEAELKLPVYFLDGMESKHEPIKESESPGSVELVYVTDREQKLLTAFRMAKESGRDFIEKAAKASGFI